MKKAKVDQLIKAAEERGHTEGYLRGGREERARQTAYLEAKPGTLDMAPPPSQLYREIVVLGRFSDLQSHTVRLRAVANVLQVQHPRDRQFAEPRLIRFFTWEFCP